MEWVETTGRSIEEAKDAALDQLGVDEDDAEFEILEEPRFGLFGRVRGEARLRARVRPTKPRPKEERRDRRGRRRSGGDGAATTAPASDDAPSTDMANAADSAPGPDTEPARPARSAPAANGGDRSAADDPVRSRRSRPGGAGPSRSRPPAPNEDDEADAASPGASTTETEGGQPSATGSRRPPGLAGRADRQQDSHDAEGSSRGGGMDVSLDEQGAVARQFLEGLVERLRLDAEIVLELREEEIVELNLQGDDLGMLIGAKGATLLAIQDLTRTVVQRRTSATNGRMFVDVSGYRRKRKDALERFARQIAEEVQTTGARRELEPMSASDRKIVHDTVNDIDGVATTSEGEEPRRRVVIFPVAN